MLGFVLLSSAAFAQLAQQDYGWDIYGDRYLLSQRPYSDVSNFFIFEGPGNLNPGNWQGLGQSDPSLRIPSELKTYIARQFKYVLFDQESFCDRNGQNGPAVSLITSVYHQEAQAIMNLDPSIIVLPYFTFTTMVSQYPWSSSVPEEWYLHQDGQPPGSDYRIRTPEGTMFLMDISNPDWRTFYKNYVISVRNSWGYRGIFLDNMTRYPYVHPDDFPYLPLQTYDDWFTHLAEFLNELQSGLDPSVVVICSSLGIDGNPNPPLLFGPDHGTALMQYVRTGGGALMEGFHSTAWRAPLDTVLNIMKYLRDNNKVFLGATHYYRGGDALLSQRFNLEPLGASGWVDDATRPPLSTFYRMQMSYLARYLLVTPNAGQPAFGYSFQPGVLLYQFIPYYKPWDERIGTAVDANYVNAGSYYKREFTNALVLVNTTENTNVITIPSAEWYWYQYPNWVPSSGNNLVDTRYTPNTVTLNKMEGIVLFKKVTLEQKLEDGTSSVGTVGRWETNQFAEYPVPKGFPFTVGTNEVLRGMQSVNQTQGAQKYNKWDLDQNVVNHRSFAIASETRKFTSNLKSTNTAHIQTVLDGVPVISSLDFSDPWLIDLTDSYGKRNQGSGAPLNSIATPFTSAAADTGYQGVFLGETYDPQNPQKPYYSGRTLLTNPNIGGFTGYFQNWSGSNATFQQAGSTSGYDQKAVVFNGNNAVVTANYKAHLASNSAAALSYNNQRKVVKWGDYHLVYQSSGDIWYTYSTDNGATWAAEQMVSATSEGHQNTNPAVDVDGLGNVYVVYEAPFGSNRAIAIKKKVSMTWTMLWSESFLASSELKPVIAVSKENSPKVVVVVQADGYTSSDPGLYYAQYGYPVGKVSETSASSLNPTLAYGNLAYQESNTIYRKSVLFTNPITISSREAVSVSSFNGRPLRDISNPSIAVREALDYEFSRRPVIAWQAIDLVFSDYRPIFVRHPVSTSGGSPVFVSTVFDWGTYNAHGRTPTVNVYQTPPDLGWENPDVSVVWQDDPIDGRYGAYQNVVVANKINGSWNTQTTLSTAGQYSSVAQGNVSQTTSGGALVCWSGTSGPILSISASQKTNSYTRPPKEEDISVLQKNDNVTNNATEYAREININLGALGIEGLTGTVGVHIEETTGAKFVPLGKLGSLEKDFLKLQNQTQSAATVKYKVWVYDLQMPQALTIPQRGLEIASLLVRKDSVTSRKKNFTLENLLGLWKANHSKLGSIEVAQDSGEVVVPTGTFVQVQTRQDTASQTSGVTYLQIIAPDNGEQLRKQAEQEIIATQLPTEFALASNYPNPFNPETQIEYQLKDGGYAKLAIYDVLGREIAALADEYQAAGYYSKSWNANLLASGMYIYRLTVRDESGKQIFTQTKRMMLTK
jgi:hypothetical protein